MSPTPPDGITKGDEKNKNEFIHDEAAQNKADTQAIIDSFSPREVKGLMWRIDLRLVLVLGLLYGVSLMDRTNLPNASIAGMQVTLNLNVQNRYNIITLVFFITYTIFQPVATVLTRKIGPRLFLSSIVVAWGAVMIGFGFVQSWTPLIGLRMVLGILEAGFFPGAAYLLSTWYPRFNLQKRNAVFYLTGSVFGALANILAYGLSLMNGLGGLEGWRWIFIIEGILTCVLGFVGLVLLADFPEEAWKGNLVPFLTKRESDFIVACIEMDRADTTPMPFNLQEYLNNAFDLKVWGFSFIFMMTTTVAYAISYFLPLILQASMGFSLALSQILVAPPYLLAAIYMYFQALYADKLRLRSPIIMVNACLGLIGLPLLGFTTNNGVRYFGVFLATLSCQSNVPAILTWQANNVRGQWKRALSSATLVGGGGIGGIIGSTVFRTQDRPGYVPGIIATMISCGLVLVVTALLDLKFWLANKRVDRGGKPIEALEGFHYTL